MGQDTVMLRHHNLLVFLFNLSYLLHIERVLRFIKLQGTLRSWRRWCHESANYVIKIAQIRTLTVSQIGKAAQPVSHFLFLSYYALLTNKYTAVFNQCCVLVILCVIPFLLLLPTAFCKRQNNSICHKTSNILYIRINKRRCSPFFIYTLLLLSSEHLHLT